MLEHNLLFRPDRREVDLLIPFEELREIPVKQGNPSWSRVIPNVLAPSTKRSLFSDSIGETITTNPLS